MELGLPEHDDHLRGVLGHHQGFIGRRITPADDGNPAPGEHGGVTRPAVGDAPALQAVLSGHAESSQGGPRGHNHRGCRHVTGGA